MKFSTLVRHIREGVKNVFRNGWMSFASIGSIVVSLFVLGVFMLLALNVNQWADQFDSQVQVNVYLESDIGQSKIDELKTRIGNIAEVKQVTFVSKEAGLEKLREDLDEDVKGALDGYKDSNPLPDSFEVELFDAQQVSYVAKQILAFNETDADKPIISVKYGQGYVEKLFRITNAVRNVGLVVVAGLAVMAMFLISTTIKMTILARRREIGIMKLVGATNNFIRWPFFIEGIIIGLAGSGITTALLLYGYSELIASTHYNMGLMMIEVVDMNKVGWLVGGSLVALGTLIGVWGSVVSVRKHLKV
ncbi:cell division transport system permease protein [Cohnella sp. OV330]|uniref:permease-like cell division protein FtsX n=1 Tax=Cohnella sp. OV330 TaxID=1855288 RepID=UPI0008E93C59|nr:permease-like cell division protein FtsX [Cohnella sp. OV330]SFB48196.1 cell division transport system permease protein [Cohnella sp. OV330]